MGNKDDKKQDVNSFVDRLCAMLRGMNAATSRNVISSTMAHLITTLDGARFQYSHEFVNLLVSQIDATLEGLPVDARIRKNKSKNGETVLWTDSSADDYIHRPNKTDFENISAYHYFSYYKKMFKTFKQMKEDMLHNDDSETTQTKLEDYANDD